MDWKQNEADDVVYERGLHEGDGTVTRRRFFQGFVEIAGED